MAFDRYLTAALLCVSAAAAAAAPAAALVEVRPDGTRTVFTTKRLNRGDQVLLPHARGAAGAPASGADCCIRMTVVGKRKSPSAVSDELGGRPVHAYALPPAKATEQMPFVGAALAIGSGQRAAASTGEAPAQAHGAPAFPQACTSSEGMHVLQLDGTKPRAHLYMHFGYAVEPSCSAALLEKFP